MKIFDPVRQKYVEQTPEELVRQNLISWLHHSKNVPLHAMEVESTLSHYHPQAHGRADLIVHGLSKGRTITQPWVLAECKTRENTSWEQLQVQISRYLKHLQPHFLILDLDTERRFYELKTSCCDMHLQPILDIPKFSQ